VPAWDAWFERRAIGQLGAPPAEAPNVLVIVMDTVRADHLSLDGYARRTTPHIDAWAAEGVVFDNAWSSTSWTLPSHASLLTGLPAYRHGADRGGRLDNRFPVLPEVLARHGYVTGAFIANTIWLNPQYGFDRGFHRFRVHTAYGDASRTVWGRKLYSTLVEERGRHAWTVRKSAAHVNADLLEWVDGNPERPFFALLNYFDVHDPYQPPPPHDTQFSGPSPDTREEKRPYRRSINLYDGLIAYVDAQIGHLRQELERRGLARNTVVVITADHGESLGDHNEPQHGRNLHRPVLRVPMVVIAPGLGPGGQHIRTAVGIEQIPATVVELLRLQQGSPFPGDPMTRWLDGAAADGAAPVLGELKQVGGALAAKSLIGSRWQYIWNAPDSREELYDLGRDPRETENLIDVAEMSATRLDFRKRLHAIFPDLGIWRETTPSAEAGAAAGSPRQGGLW
jgi:arylsulfatase A-like enzyme